MVGEICQIPTYFFTFGTQFRSSFACLNVVAVATISKVILRSAKAISPSVGQPVKAGPSDESDAWSEIHCSERQSQRIVPDTRRPDLGEISFGSDSTLLGQ